MDNQSLNQLTILLAVSGRDQCTERWLSYMEAIKFDGKIIIADGKNNGNALNIYKNFKPNSNLKLSFLQFDTGDSYLKYYELMRDSIEHVSTKYLLLADNDDFIIPSGIKNICSTMVQNNELISVGGRVGNFQIDGGSNNAYGKKFEFLNGYKYERFDDVDNISEHITNTFKSFQPYYYNVFKTEILHKIFTEIVELNFRELYIMEFFIYLRMFTLGKSIILPNQFHLIRQRGTSQTSGNFDHFEALVKSNIPNDILKIIPIINQYDAIDIEEKLLGEYMNYIQPFIYSEAIREKLPFARKLLSLIRSLKNSIPLYRDIKIKMLNKSVYNSVASKNEIAAAEYMFVNKFFDKISKDKI
jgi:glycosyltransferase domain-containing protein